MPGLDDQELWDLIWHLEDELLEDGVDLKQRYLLLPVRAMERLGYKSFALSGPREPVLLRRIRTLHKTLYRKKDVAVGALHGGAFMFRGIAVQIHVPLILGSAQLRPFEHNDLSPQQKDWLASDPEQAEAYISTYCDIFDFSACCQPCDGYGESLDSDGGLLHLSAFQLQGAGATLCATFDERGAIQSSLVGAELALKAALATSGSSTTDLKRYRHDLQGLAKAVGDVYSDFDLALVTARIRQLPNLIDNRYSAQQPSRMETGNIVMACQLIAGAVARTLTGSSLRERLRID